jgi:hypothetical protein
MASQRRDAPTILLVAALISAGLLMVVLCWDLTFFQDTWAFLLERRGHSIGDFLRPHNEHLVLIPVLVTKVCENLFGLTSAHPEMFVMTASLLAVAGLLFVYVRRRVGSWLALAAVLPVLFLGSSWMVLLWPFEIEFSGAAAAGLAAMLLMERDDRRGDAWACLLLLVAIGFGSLGLSFAFAAAVAVWQTRGTRGWSRAYVVVVPAILYLAWYAGWGHTAEHHLTLDNVLHSPLFVFEGLASSAASLFGLNTETEAATAEPVWGRPLILILIGLAVLWKRRRPGISPLFWRPLAAAASYWLLAAFNFIPGREAASNRYVYAGVIFLLMMAADLFQGVRLTRRSLVITFVVAVCVVLPNIALMKEGSEVLKTQSELTRADTGAIQIARRTIPAEMVMDPTITGTLANVAIVPGPYLEVTDQNGSPAYSPSELVHASPLAQHWADVFLSKALPISFEVSSGPQTAGSNCSTLGGEGAEAEAELGPGTVTIAAAPTAEAKLTARRFSAAEFPVELGVIPAGELGTLSIPPDGATQPWHLKVEAGEAARVCR